MPSHKVECASSDTVLNPSTGKYVKKTGRIGRQIMQKSGDMPSHKASDTVLNPSTGKYVKKTGRIGRQIMQKSALSELSEKRNKRGKQPTAKIDGRQPFTVDVRKGKSPSVTFTVQDFDATRLAPLMRSFLHHKTLQRMLLTYPEPNYIMNMSGGGEKGVNLSDASVAFVFRFNPLPLRWLRTPALPAQLSSQFKKIRCDPVKGFPNIKANNCLIGNPQKLFYRKAQTLGQYAALMATPTRETLRDHNKMFGIISKWKKFRNHNLDVPLLHFK